MTVVQKSPQSPARPAGESAEAACPAGSAAAPPAETLELAAVLHALSDPVRLGIVCTLARAGAEAELACKAFSLPVVKSTATHHFRVLREAGVIRQRVCGTTRLNTLRRADLELRFPGLLDAVLAAAPAAPAGR